MPSLTSFPFVSASHLAIYSLCSHQRSSHVAKLLIFSVNFDFFLFNLLCENLPLPPARCRDLIRQVMSYLVISCLKPVPMLDATRGSPKMVLPTDDAYCNSATLIINVYIITNLEGIFAAPRLCITTLKVFGIVDSAFSDMYEYVEGLFTCYFNIVIGYAVFNSSYNFCLTCP